MEDRLGRFAGGGGGHPPGSMEAAPRPHRASAKGEGHWRIMTRIIFPMALPGMISMAIYGFVWSWNDLLCSMTLVTDTSRRALASGLAMTFLGEGSTNWGYMMAASIVAAIPVTIIFVFLQRYFIQGLTAAARQIKSCVALAAARKQTCGPQVCFFIWPRPAKSLFQQ